VLGVALFGSLLATGVVGGLHASLTISIALLLATGALALVLPEVRSGVDGREERVHDARGRRA
jgi:hypothetical protein